ncbi:MAG: mechanosensitive ion channel [Burkholderiaceae bacterium]|nr:mechanosensitive ion channel [Burkholderiaceae bacterium]
MTAASPAAAELASSTTLQLNNRRVVTFRASLLGDSAAERAEMARQALLSGLAKRGPGLVSRSVVGDAVRFELDGQTLFFLVAGDLTGSRPGAMLEAASLDVMRRLQLAVHETREFADPRRLAEGAAYSVAATVIAYLLMRLVLMLRGKLLARLDAQVQGWRYATQARALVATYADHARPVARFMAAALSWGLGLLLLDFWLTYVLRQFAYTRPWGERSTAWLLEVLERFALAIAGAVPGLITAALIFVLARLVTRAVGLFLQRVERDDLHIGWLDADTAGPTRSLGTVVIWLFALAMAYPYLPGANSDAFKGVSVLAGVMLSLGASSIVGQVLSGFSLMYTRVLRVGEYVKIGDTEGSVVALGMFATRIHTGMGEEVSLPNTLVSSQPVRNFSRLVADGHFVLHTSVTIGYATPWRQVHAMLLEAARRTAGVAPDPAPYVVQTALSDFYIEYRLCAQSNKQAPQRRVEAMNQLHGHVLDVFNENGVQIMSPHYRADPAEPQIVAPGPWFPAAGQGVAPDGQAPR